MNKKAYRNYIKAISQRVDRKKMYKSHKQWVVAGMSFLVALGGAGLAISNPNAHASKIDNNQPTTQKVTNNKPASNQTRNNQSNSNKNATNNNNSSLKSIKLSASNLHKSILNNNTNDKTSIHNNSEANSSNTKANNNINSDSNATSHNVKIAKKNNQLTEPKVITNNQLTKQSNSSKNYVSINEPFLLNRNQNNSESNKNDTSTTNGRTNSLNNISDSSINVGEPSLKKVSMKLNANENTGTQKANRNENQIDDIKKIQNNNAVQTFQDANKYSTPSIKIKSNIAYITGDLSQYDDGIPLYNQTNNINKPVSELHFYGNIKLPSDCKSLFSGMDVKHITEDINTYFDTKNVTNMSDMFSGDQFYNINFAKNWNTSNVRSMQSMFNNNSNLNNINGAIHWDTHNVSNMSGMFGGDMNLNDIYPLSNWDTSNVSDMSLMFFNGSSNVDVSNLEDINPLKNWNTSRVTNMSQMFTDDNNLINRTPIPNWHISDGGSVDPIPHQLGNKTDSITYHYNNQVISTTTQSGKPNSTGTITTTPAGWNLTNSDNTNITYNGNPVNLNVTPKKQTDKINYVDKSSPIKNVDGFSMNGIANNNAANGKNIIENAHIISNNSNNDYNNWCFYSALYNAGNAQSKNNNVKSLFYNGNTLENPERTGFNYTNNISTKNKQRIYKLAKDIDNTAHNGIVIGTLTATGNDFRTSKYTSNTNFTIGSDPTNLPLSDTVNNPNQVINYDGNTHNVDVAYHTPVNNTVKINYSDNGIKKHISDTINGAVGRKVNLNNYINKNLPSDYAINNQITINSRKVNTRDASVTIKNPIPTYGKAYAHYNATTKTLELSGDLFNYINGNEIKPDGQYFSNLDSKIPSNWNNINTIKFIGNTKLPSFCSGIFQDMNNLVTVITSDNAYVNTSNVTNMGVMFGDDKNLTNIQGLANWDTSHVTTIAQMFISDNSLNNISPLANWNTSNFSDYFDHIFAGDNHLENKLGYQVGIRPDNTQVNINGKDFPKIAQWNMMDNGDVINGKQAGSNYGKSTPIPSNTINNVNVPVKQTTNYNNIINNIQNNSNTANNDNNIANIVNNHASDASESTAIANDKKNIANDSSSINNDLNNAINDSENNKASDANKAGQNASSEASDANKALNDIINQNSKASTSDITRNNTNDSKEISSASSATNSNYNHKISLKSSNSADNNENNSINNDNKVISLASGYIHSHSANNSSNASNDSKEASSANSAENDAKNQSSIASDINSVINSESSSASNSAKNANNKASNSNEINSAKNAINSDSNNVKNLPNNNDKADSSANSKINHDKSIINSMSNSINSNNITPASASSDASKANDARNNANVENSIANQSANNTSIYSNEISSIKGNISNILSKANAIASQSDIENDSKASLVSGISNASQVVSNDIALITNASNALNSMSINSANVSKANSNLSDATSALSNAQSKANDFVTNTMYFINNSDNQLINGKVVGTANITGFIGEKENIEPQFVNNIPYGYNFSANSDWFTPQKGGIIPNTSNNASMIEPGMLMLGASEPTTNDNHDIYVEGDPVTYKGNINFNFQLPNSTKVVSSSLPYSINTRVGSSDIQIINPADVQLDTLKYVPSGYNINDFKLIKNDIYNNAINKFGVPANIIPQGQKNAVVNNNYDLTFTPVKTNDPSQINPIEITYMTENGHYINSITGSDLGTTNNNEVSQNDTYIITPTQLSKLGAVSDTINLVKSGYLRVPTNYHFNNNVTNNNGNSLSAYVIPRRTDQPTAITMIVETPSLVPNSNNNAIASASASASASNSAKNASISASISASNTINSINNSINNRIASNEANRNRDNSTIASANNSASNSINNAKNSIASLSNSISKSASNTIKSAELNHNTDNNRANSTIASINSASSSASASIANTESSLNNKSASISNVIKSAENNKLNQESTDNNNINNLENEIKSLNNENTSLRAKEQGSISSNVIPNSSSNQSSNGITRSNINGTGIPTKNTPRISNYVPNNTPFTLGTSNTPNGTSGNINSNKTNSNELPQTNEANNNYVLTSLVITLLFSLGLAGVDLDHRYNK